MARTDRSRIEVHPVDGGFALRRFDKYGRAAAPPTRKVLSRRNNARREAIRFLRRRGLTMPIISVGVKAKTPGESIADGLRQAIEMAAAQ